MVKIVYPRTIKALPSSLEFEVDEQEDKIHIRMSCNRTGFKNRTVFMKKNTWDYNSIPGQICYYKYQLYKEYRALILEVE